LTFTKLATYSASVVKSNFGSCQGVDSKSTVMHIERRFVICDQKDVIGRIRVTTDYICVCACMCAYVNIYAFGITF